MKLIKSFSIGARVKFSKPILEFCYKNDDLGDPMINESHIELLNIATHKEIEFVKSQAFKINKILTEIFDNINIDLVDFKIEFGRKNNGLIILADEISPDSCRLWDKASKEKYDKDRFRLDLGGLVEYYKKLAKKLNISLDYE